MGESRRQLSGQRALVTGASSGIGAAVADQLAACGASLVITARRVERLQSLALALRTRFGADVQVLPFDLADRASAKALFEETEGRGLAIDILINNAGFGAYAPFEEVPWQRYDEMLHLNIVSLTELTWRFVPAMRARGRGHIVNIASLAAFLPCPKLAVYSATKSYVRNLTEALDEELRGSGVRATAICPGLVSTEFSEKAQHRVRGAALRISMSAEKCARLTVDAMLRRKRLVIPGFVNAAGGVVLRLLPRRWVPRLANAVMKPAVERTGQTGPNSR